MVSQRRTTHKSGGGAGSSGSKPGQTTEGCEVDVAVRNALTGGMADGPDRQHMRLQQRIPNMGAPRLVGKENGGDQVPELLPLRE
jgi:hypothetical protein